MPRHVTAPIEIKAAGEPPKTILELFGRVCTGDERLSIAHMKSPAGWSEPGQTPEFDEYSVVLAGMLRVRTRSGTIEVGPGQGVHVTAGEWVQYDTPAAGGAEYIAVCIPAFSPETVHRDS